MRRKLLQTIFSVVALLLCMTVLTETATLATQAEGTVDLFDYGDERTENNESIPAKIIVNNRFIAVPFRKTVSRLLRNRGRCLYWDYPTFQYRWILPLLGVRKKHRPPVPCHRKMQGTEATGQPNRIWLIFSLQLQPVKHSALTGA